MKNYIDVKIKSWGNGSSSGPWVKFDLSDDEELEEKHRNAEEDLADLDP